MSKEQFNDWCERYMRAPKRIALRKDLDGNVREVDLDKCVAIKPECVQAAMDNPRMRSMMILT